MMLDTMARVRELLDARGLTMYQLSVLSDIPYCTLKSTENRCGRLSVDTIYKICRGLRITMSEFFRDAERWEPAC